MLLVDSLLPQVCQLCGGSARGMALCAACARDLPWNRPCCPRCAQPQTYDHPCAACAKQPPGFDSAWCPLRLESPVHASIHRLKYRAGFLQADVLGQLMATHLARRAAPLPQVLLPVPLHAGRLRWRGYNQAVEIARILVRALPVRLDLEGARRLRRTEDQIGKTAAQRRRNVKGAFTVSRDLGGLHIALLDDVMTTGATLEELARVCRKAGAARIEAWAAARVA